MAVDLSSLGVSNPLSSLGIGSMSSFAMILLVFFIAVIIVGLIAGIIYMSIVRKQFWIKLRMFKLVGNVPTELGCYSAKPVKFGMAGDVLWRVAPSSAFGKVFKIIKWIPAGKLQTARNEFWYWVREDGEWINFVMGDIDKKSLEAGVRFVKEDMRLQRLATERLLQQRLMSKTFWEKWGNTIMTIILFLVIAVCVVIIFYQFSKLLDQITPLIQEILKHDLSIQQACIQNKTSSGLIPAG